MASIYGAFYLPDDLKPELVKCLRGGTIEDAVRGNAITGGRYSEMDAVYRPLAQRIRDLPTADQIAEAEDRLADAREDLAEAHQQFQVARQYYDRARRECERLEGAALKGRMQREHFFRQTLSTLYSWGCLIFDAVEPLLVEKGFRRLDGGKLEDVTLKPKPPDAEAPEPERPVAIRPDGRTHAWCSSCKTGAHLVAIGQRGPDTRLCRCEGCGYVVSVDVTEERRLLSAMGY